MLSTKLVMQQLKQEPEKWFEFTIMLNIFRCTHFLCFSNNKILSIGIDSEESQFSQKEFLIFFSKTVWKN